MITTVLDWLFQLAQHCVPVPVKLCRLSQKRNTVSKKKMLSLSIDPSLHPVVNLCIMIQEYILDADSPATCKQDMYPLSLPFRNSDKKKMFKTISVLDFKKLLETG